VSRSSSFDVAVIGAGVFGAWTTRFLRGRNLSVALIEASAPGNSRSSSGGESRIFRMGYGPNELYARLALASLPQWRELAERTGAPLFQHTGVLWLVRGEDSYAAASLATFERIGIPYDILSPHELTRRLPQFALHPSEWGIFEPKAGVLLARRAVAAVVSEAVAAGAEYFTAAVLQPKGSGKLEAVCTSSGEIIRASHFVFACGPWLPHLFPSLLGQRIFVSRQEVYFFGVPPGDSRFSPPSLPTWISTADEFYGMPDIEGRGVKIALDRHGPLMDPETSSRIPSPELMDKVRTYLGKRFPSLANAPALESRVCQYENTSSGDFLIDRHPDYANVWLAGGGSGHGFKHGPAVGEYITTMVIEGRTPEPSFSLASKATIQRRAIF
jgi:sarcosine oxidase